MSIPIDMREVLDEFLRKIFAFDRTDTLEDHKTKSVNGADYSFVGVLIKTTEDDLQMLDEGEIKNGSITIFSRGRELFFKDIQGEDEVGKQTFIRHENKLWRIKAETNRLSDGLYIKYLAVRWIER